ncbi:MAG: histidine kinase [Clostridia bacterium]|nr:histidine kinase [Clostridia bacterium]
MSTNIIICIVLYAISVFQSIFLIIYILVKGRKTSTLYSLISCQILVLLWLIFGLFEETYQTIDQLWLYTKLAFLPICFIGTSFLTFSISYTERKWLQNKLFRSIVFVIPTLLYLTVLTNEHHHLFIRRMEIGKINEWGILFWMCAAYIYICLFSGIVLLAKYSLEKHRNLKKQFVILMISVAIPVITNILTGFKIIPSPQFDLTPATFSLSLTMITFGIFKHRLLNIIPFALKEIAESMKESVIVVDNNNHIIDFNQSFVSEFNNYIRINRKDRIQTFIEKLKCFSNDNCVIDEMSTFLLKGEGTYFENEISISFPDKVSYFLYIRPILSSKQGILGKIISFTNITNYKMLIDKLEQKNTEIQLMNEELTALNEQLQDYSKTVEELTIEKERNRFSKDAHDTLGHSMAILIALLEMTRADYDHKPLVVKDNLDQAIAISREGLNELRRTISGLAPKILKQENIVDSINSLISNFAPSGMKVDFTVQGTIRSLCSLRSNTVYRICQESLTNSLRHGKAKNVTMILKFYDTHLRLWISDDGQGCGKIEKGFGLAGMQQRVDRLGGNITYGTGEECGFFINALIPLEVTKPI